MKYGIFTIDVPGANLGNRLIEYSIKELLGIGKPSVSVSMFKQPSEDEVAALNSCDFVILPGATILANGRGQGEALNYLHKIKVPKFCCAAGGWEPKFKLNKEVLKYITEPLGIRDPITHKQCLEYGVKSLFMGCTTAYVPKSVVTHAESYTIVGFARENMPWQTTCFKRLRGKLVAAIQEKSHEYSWASSVTKNIFLYENPKEVYEKYAGCAITYTGRLHGCLPALSQGKPVVFFGDEKDSRFSLLKHLGVIINQFGEYSSLKQTPLQQYSTRLVELKQTFDEWKKETIDKFKK